MVQLTTAANLQNAIIKARIVKPRVRINRFGNYTVTNKQTGVSYTVTCEKHDGKRLAHCTCKAGASGKVCYHVAAAIPAHMVLAAERATLNS
jgi:hypothetical protein